jgi:hypothetical protein
MLAFRYRPGEQEICRQGIPSRHCSRQRFASEWRGDKARGCDAYSYGNGLCEGEQKQPNKTRMAGSFPLPNSESNSRSISVRKLLHARFVGFRHMCDLEVCHPSHNFVLGNGIVTSNSHATAYSAVSTAELWLKHNFLPEFLCALINNTDPGKEKHGSDNIMVEYINYARRKGVSVLGPHISESKSSFILNAAGAIRFSLSHVKFVASKAEIIESVQPIGRR